MREPLVAAVMLTRDRPEMAARAVRCFRRQTYNPASRILVIADSGDPTWYDPSSDSENEMYVQIPSHGGIGALRNRVNEMAPTRLNTVLIHWDDDDISHPGRIAEQVALLQASGEPCVAYNELLFWRSIECPTEGCLGGPAGLGSDGMACTQCGGRTMVEEAWLYHRGSRTETSLCYWRETWEKTPFPEVNTPPGTMQRGEGLPCNWRVHSLDVSSIAKGEFPGTMEHPSLIATIHAGNARHYHAGDMAASPNWRRVPEWDDYVYRTVGES